MALWPTVGQVLLTVDASRSQSQTTQWVGLLWMSDRPVADLTTHNTHSRQISMPSVAFEPAVSAGERPQTHVLDRAAKGTDF